MARAKQCEEEFNPWPPFVDVFSSVVLVLLLFIMVLIVNVAYYMQYNAKSDTPSSTQAKIDSSQAAEKFSEIISLPKIKKPQLATAGKNALFEGGKSSGNAITLPPKKEKPLMQKVDRLSSESIAIAYDNKELFLKQTSIQKVERFIKAHLGKKMVLTMSLPTQLPSHTYAKQIALARVISVKSLLLKKGVKISNVTLKITRHRDNKYPHGMVQIRVVK